MRPDLYVLVVDGANPDFKSSCQRVLDRVDIVVDTSGAPWAWAGVPVGILEKRPRYFAPAPDYADAELAQAPGSPSTRSTLQPVSIGEVGNLIPANEVIKCQIWKQCLYEWKNLAEY